VWPGHDACSSGRVRPRHYGACVVFWVRCGSQLAARREEARRAGGQGRATTSWLVGRTALATGNADVRTRRESASDGASIAFSEPSIRASSGGGACGGSRTGKSRRWDVLGRDSRLGRHEVHSRSDSKTVRASTTEETGHRHLDGDLRVFLAQDLEESRRGRMDDEAPPALPRDRWPNAGRWLLSAISQTCSPRPEVSECFAPRAHDDHLASSR